MNGTTEPIETATEENATPEVVILAATYSAFGMAMDIIAESEVFASFPVGEVAGVIRRQLADGHNLGAVIDGRLVGYIGWLHTTAAMGESWMENRSMLRPLSPEISDAVALTIFVSQDAGVTRRLIRGARDLNRGRRVFFKRSYESGIRTNRKESVLNL
jgi:hemolysin-activating ACP:hemolysin acyltransferase